MPSPIRAHGERMYRSGCRCTACLAWRSHANAISRARRAAGKDRHINPSHGTERRYAAGCRCNPCLAAYARQKARNAAHYHRRLQQPAVREACRQNNRAWRAANRDHIRAYGAAWRKANHEKVRAYASAWRAAHPEKVRAYASASRASRQPLTTAWPFTRDAAYLDPFTAAINAAIPRTLPADVREDIAQDLAVDLLTNGGAITPEAISAAVRAYWKRYPVMAGRMLSLDAPTFAADGDSRERRIDRIPHPASVAALEEERATRYAGRRQ